MFTIPDYFICFWAFFHISVIVCLPAPNEEVVRSYTISSSKNDITEASKISNIDDISDRISSIADSSSKIANNLVSTFESTGKILTNVMEAKRRIAEPLIKGSVETLDTIAKSKVIERGLHTVKTVAESGARKSSDISESLAKSASLISRSGKSLKSDDEDRNNSEKSEGLTDSIASIIDSSGKLISKLLSTMVTSAKIISDVIEAKRKIVEPVVENTARNLKALSESDTIERGLKTVQTLTNAGIQTSIGATTALARAGSSTTPALLQGINTVNDITLRAVRLGICAVICPLQDEDEKESCQQENCGKLSKVQDSKED